MNAARAKRGGVLEATIFAIVGVAILIGFGVWQLDRLAWKENLVATVNERIAQPAQPLPPRESWSRLLPAGSEYARVTFPAEFLEGQEALAYTSGSSLRPDVKGQGYWVFSPARLAGGSVILVNRGFVPSDKKDAATRADGAPHGSVDIVGYMRWPEARGLFTPADDVKGNVFFARDIKAMSDAHRWGVAAPFYIDMEGPVPPGGLPKPGKIDVQLPNSHFQYALTWFGLALGLAGVYIVWLAGRLRRRA
ncbi:MAG TPA: SURF1 family protein [Pseudolabrys sp.]|nr:SURF1 family protein [Pseudolabrys sp.]